MAVISISSLLYWIPANIIYLAAVMMDRYPMEMVEWSMVAVVPIYSVVYPLVFIGTSARSLWRKKFPRTRHRALQQE